MKHPRVILSGPHPVNGSRLLLTPTRTADRYSGLDWELEILGRYIPPNHATVATDTLVCGIPRTTGSVRVGAVTCPDCLTTLD